ncbi:MAG: peptidase M4 family protein, partial [Deltaproteobacteria bacterium]
MHRHLLLRIVPPHMLKHLAETGDTRLPELAWRTLVASEQFRGGRQAIGAITPLAATPTGAKRCT